MIKEIVHFFSAARMEQIVFAHVIGKHQQHRIIQIAVNRMLQMQPHGRITVDCHARREKFARLFERLRKEVSHLTPSISITPESFQHLFSTAHQYKITSDSYISLFDDYTSFVFHFPVLFCVFIYFLRLFPCFLAKKADFQTVNGRGREAGGRKIPAVRTPVGGTKLSGKRSGPRHGGAGACGRRAINVGTLSAGTEHPPGFACGCTGGDFFRRHPAVLRPHRRDAPPLSCARIDKIRSPRCGILNASP